MSACAGRKEKEMANLEPSALVRVTKPDADAVNWVFNLYREPDEHRQPTPEEVDALGADTEMFALYRPATPQEKRALKLVQPAPDDPDDPPPRLVKFAGIFVMRIKPSVAW